MVLFFVVDVLFHRIVLCSVDVALKEIPLEIAREAFLYDFSYQEEEIIPVFSTENEEIPPSQFCIIHSFLYVPKTFII